MPGLGIAQRWAHSVIPIFSLRAGRGFRPLTLLLSLRLSLSRCKVFRAALP